MSNQAIHDEMMEKLSQVKDIRNLHGVFSNPDTYGGIHSHISFICDYEDEYNHRIFRLYIDYKYNEVNIKSIEGNMVHISTIDNVNSIIQKLATHCRDIDNHLNNK